MLLTATTQKTFVPSIPMIYAFTLAAVPAEWHALCEGVQ